MDTLVEDADRVEVRAVNLRLTDSLKDDLRAVIEKHGGKLESFGHPTTTLEDLFKKVVEESKARPGRRYLPAGDGERAAATRASGSRVSDPMMTNRVGSRDAARLWPIEGTTPCWPHSPPSWGS